MSGPSKLSDFRPSVFDIRPPGPSRSNGYKVTPSRGGDGDSDEAHYILKPDIEFNRPWLGSPQANSGIAFVWPLGVEGFTYTSNAETGIHHYIGDNDVDVDVVYPDEEHIVLSGNFPGDRSVDNMLALKQVVLHQADEPGKLLGLPGIEDIVLYVAVINRQFNHDAADFTKGVSYSIEFIRTGVGAKLGTTVTQLPTQNPTARKAPRGKSHKRAVVKGHRQTLRGVTSKVYKNSGGNSLRTLQKKNVTTLEKAGIPAHKQPYAKIPLGTKLEF